MCSSDLNDETRDRDGDFRGDDQLVGLDPGQRGIVREGLRLRRERRRATGTRTIQPAGNRHDSTGIPRVNWSLAVNSQIAAMTIVVIRSAIKTSDRSPVMRRREGFQIDDFQGFVEKGTMSGGRGSCRA